jgi:hypothetical protein
MILYHGGVVTVTKPKIIKATRARDIKAQKLVDQYAFVTPVAIRKLKFISSEEV